MTDRQHTSAALTQFDGRHLLLVADGQLGTALHDGLTTAGAKVARVSPAGGAPNEMAVCVALYEHAAFDEGVARAVAMLGEADAIVVALAPAALTEAGDFNNSDDAWQVCDAILCASLHALQYADRLFAPTGGSVLFVGPALAMSGASGLVALATASEGQRALAKSAARQLGAQRINVNWLAIPNELFARGLARHAPPGPELGPPPPALGVPESLADGVLPAIAWLTGAQARGVTGATLCADGGDWMVP